MYSSPYRRPLLGYISFKHNPYIWTRLFSYWSLRSLPYIFSSVPYHLEFPILIWKLLVTGDISKCPHLSYILIPVVGDDDEVSVVNRLLTKMEVLHHWFYFLLKEILYLSKYIGVIFTT